MRIDGERIWEVKSSFIYAVGFGGDGIFQIDIYIWRRGLGMLTESNDGAKVEFVIAG